ncbi:coiled-coil domain-containing protein 68-like [Acipenser ruthenus]|uniref:coiled-coil domain-containing protein 68-like n=1 Tax=Acipenser ruthenus TaxID=7906 RepID=UPI002741EA95|nr:coiled-coil domain-containing protein 68-like [Acipenser ruthenus]
MTAVTTLTKIGYDVVTREDPEKDRSVLFYGCSASQFREETEYIKKIRSTLEKVRTQVFGDDCDGCRRQTSGDEVRNQTPWNSSDSETRATSFYSRYHQILEDIKEKDRQLYHINLENQELEIRLEASREAGAGALRDASRKLFDMYQMRLEEVRRKHLEDKQILQAYTEEQEQNLRKRMEMASTLEEKQTRVSELEKRVERMENAYTEEQEQNLRKRMEMASTLEEKQTRVSELEKRVERMENEKKVLTERNKFIEKETLSISHNHPGDIKSLRACQMEAAVLREKMSHLDDIVLSQNRKLRSSIQQIEQLKRELSGQDKVLWSLHERLLSAEAQNKELKYKVDFWSSQHPEVASTAVSVNSLPLKRKFPLPRLTTISHSITSYGLQSSGTTCECKNSSCLVKE